MSVSVAVMAHPARRTLAERLRARLGVGVPVEYDRGLGEWDTGRRALLAGVEAGAEWHTVVQDDAIVPNGFLASLEHVLAFVPAGVPLGLYVGRCRPASRLYVKAVRSAHLAGSPWLEQAGGPRWGVAVAIPTADLEALVARADEARPKTLYDVRLTRYYRDRDVSARYPIPSLVDHPPDNVSVLGSLPGNRCAHDYVGERDVRTIDWTRDPVVIDRRGRLAVPAGA